MKNIFWKWIFIKVVLIMFFAWYCSNIHANSPWTTQVTGETATTISEKITEISLLLNHQNFKSARTQSSTLWETISEKDILALSRENFLSLINIYNFSGKTDTAKNYIKQRWELYPTEQNLCSLSVLYYGYEQTCIWDASEAAFIDKVSYGFHLLIAWTWSKNEMESYIRKLVPLATTLQDKSDLWNLIGYYLNVYPDKKHLNIFARKLGEEIVKKDPAWVNGYLLKLNWYNKNSRIRLLIIKDLKKHYRWDAQRLKEILSNLKK